MALEWNVWVGWWNKPIEKHNIFDHHGVMEDLREAYKKYKDDPAQFEERVRRTLMYHYWSKCEWEVVVSHWPPDIEHIERYEKLSRKLDVWAQVSVNWRHFMDYLWEHREELRGGKRKEKRAAVPESVGVEEQISIDEWLYAEE